jgi:hypothetical protein
MHKWQSLPCAMGVQVSRGHHTKVPAQSLLWETAKADWRDPARVVSSERSGIAGGTLHGGSHPHVPEHSA